MIGCDPEIILADAYRNDFFDAEEYANTADHIGNDRLSLDGSGICMELRPTPSNDIFVLLSDIYNLMNALISDDENILIYSGPMPFRKHPLGGHVHIGTNDKDFISNNLDLVELCQYMWEMVYPLFYKPEEMNYRRARGYGRANDYRGQSYNHGLVGIEYRTPCSWLSNPITAYMVLSSMKIALKISSDEVNLRDIKSQFKRLTKSKFLDFICYNGYLESDTKYFPRLYTQFKKEGSSLLECNEPINNNWKVLPL